MSQWDVHGSERRIRSFPKCHVGSRYYSDVAKMVTQAKPCISIAHLRLSSFVMFYVMHSLKGLNNQSGDSCTKPELA